MSITQIARDVIEARRRSGEALADKKLWDDLGNYCRIRLYCIGQDVFELWLHDFNSAIPRRVVGALWVCNMHAETWLEIKKASGFKEQLPGYRPIDWPDNWKPASWMN